MDLPSEDPKNTLAAKGTETPKAESQQLQSPFERIVTPEEPAASKRGLKREPPGNWETGRVTKCHFEPTSRESRPAPPMAEKVLRVRSIGLPNAETGVLITEEALRAHRAEIASALEQAGQIALEIGTIDRMEPERPVTGGRRHYQRRNSFVDRSGGRFPYPSLEPCGDGTVLQADRMRHHSLTMPSRFKLNSENEGGLVPLLSRAESDMLLQGMNMTRSTKTRCKQDL
jgi:hypothetical protein